MGLRKIIATVGLVGSLAFSGCDIPKEKNGSKEYTLPNGVKVSLDYGYFEHCRQNGDTEEERNFNPVERDSYGNTYLRDNIYSIDEELYSGARLIGEITYIGFAKKPENNIEEISINQNTTDHWGDDNTGNNYANLPSLNGEVVIKVRCNENSKYKERLLVVHSNERGKNAAPLLDLLSEGDKVSFPTIKNLGNRRSENWRERYSEYLVTDLQTLSFNPGEIIKVESKE